MHDGFRLPGVTKLTVSGDVTNQTISGTRALPAMLKFLWVPSVDEVLCAKSR